MQHAGDPCVACQDSFFAYFEFPLGRALGFRLLAANAVIESIIPGCGAEASPVQTCNLSASRHKNLPAFHAYQGSHMLKYVWAFPATAVGLVLALFARTAGATAVVVDGVIEVAGGRFGKLVSALPHPLRFSAITVGHVVLGIDHSILQGCRAHE